MRRKHIFTTSSDLINQAVAEYRALKQSFVPAADVPCAVMRLSVKYKKILEKHAADPRVSELAEFPNEKERYAAELKQYLQDLSEDIATTEWKIAVKYPEPVWQLHLMSDSSDKDEEDEYIDVSENGAWRWEAGMPRAVRIMKVALEEMKQNQNLDAQKIISIYETIRRQIVDLGKEKQQYAETSVFYRYHRDEMNSQYFSRSSQTSHQLSSSR